MRALAASPFLVSLQARMRVERLSATRCFAASKPRPTLPPVMIIVLPDRSAGGMLGRPKYCPPRNWVMSPKVGMLLVSYACDLQMPPK